VVTVAFLVGFGSMTAALWLTDELGRRMRSQRQRRRPLPRRHLPPLCHHDDAISGRTRRAVGVGISAPTLTTSGP
jgi:hypothetical protein